ncbi:MAG: PEGA domain-containing protein [Sandaracinaceae bacterium]|nr:PEGA domain-containing protein [Sandaracinaceae bacterium]
MSDPHRPPDPPKRPGPAWVPSGAAPLPDPSGGGGMVVGPVQGSVGGPSMDIGPVSSEVPAASGAGSGHGAGDYAPQGEWGKPGEWDKLGEQGSEWSKPEEWAKPSDYAAAGKEASKAVAGAALKTKRDLLLAALVGAMAGGAAGTVAGGGAGLGAGWLSSDKGDDEPAQLEEEGAPARAGASGSLRVLSQPSGAAVSMDDHALGNTPVDVRAASGMHTVRVTLDGYEPHVVHASVPAGDSLTLSVALSAVPRRPSRPRRARAARERDPRSDRGLRRGATATASVAIASGSAAARRRAAR